MSIGRKEKRMDKSSPFFPKGRQVEEGALNQIKNLLGNRPRRTDLLVEHLHLIQDNFGYITAKHLAALAQEMRMAMAEVFEVATFYAHFDIVLDGEKPPPKLTIRVCDSLTCELMGAKKLLRSLKKNLDNTVRIVRAPCMGRCETSPICEVGHYHINKATLKKVIKAIDKGQTDPEIPPFKDFNSYKTDGGYLLLENCLNKKHTVDELIEVLSASGLRGLGGAGFPTGQKWKIVRSYEGHRLMAVNADEGEPGTFKDRTYLESDPHRFLEGMLIAAWVVEAKEIYIYLRDEYPGIRKTLLEQISKIKSEGLSDHTTIHLRRGAGAYICGEESAMIESIEGKRGLPRHRPPYVAEVGLFGRPTLVQNVETLYWIREIFERGPDWFSSHGRNGRKGLRSFSVSGRVREPGVKLAPAGITMRELIDEYCGGMAEGHTFKAYLPGGASGGILSAEMSNIPLDFGTLEEHGCFIGSAAIVALSDKDSTRDAALNLMRFFKDESCGQCTPCRVGTEKATKLMEQKQWDEDLLRELSNVMTDASICGLGQAASNPLKMVLDHFRDDITFK
ncbi:MAG: NAD(P)H-dependent oxidoreductase subunit E [Pseudomonadota bacterium]|nr:NAD(P)H-dependent oxidoreductase subunit E [Pseudomonadota bacterium]